MAKTYNTLGTVAPGDVLRANSGTASYNGLITNVNNYRVPPMCILDRTAALNQTTSGAYQAFTFDTETLDTDGMWASSPNPTRVTVATDGVYSVNLIVSISAVSGIVATAIKKNGNFVAFLQSKAAHSAASYMTGTCYLSLVATDYIEAFVYQDTGGSVAMDATLSVMWVGQVS